MYLLFSGKKSVPNLPSLFMLGREIERKNQTKFLGLVLDDALSWKPHIEAAANKISRMIGVLSKIRTNLTVESSKLIYYSFVHSHMRYGLVYWQAAAGIYLNRISLLNKRAIRLITASPRLEHTNPLFRKCGILKFEDLCSLELAKFIHRDLIYGNHFVLETHAHRHTYSTRGRLNLVLPQTQTNLAHKFVTFAGVSLYNNLPDTLKSCEDLVSFKIGYKNILLNLYGE